MTEENITSFLTFTSSTNEDVARQYLEMAGGNLENAVGLFMEMGGENGLSGGVGRASTEGGTRSSSSLAGSDGLDPNLDPATRAAILAAQGPSGGTPVRAPDQTRSMRLVGGDDSSSASHAALLSAVAGPHAAQMMMRPEDELTAISSTWGMDVRSDVNREAMRRGRGSGSTPFDAVDLGQSDEEDGSTGDSRPIHASGGAATSLSTMFSPPTHLMHRAGGFQGARNVAKDARRWLLVNVQNDGDFACHALNRDVWRDELVENLVREGFIFWQVVSV
jgi:hypothetical protein